MSIAFAAGDRVRFSREILHGSDRFSDLIGVVTEVEPPDVRVRWQGQWKQIDRETGAVTMRDYEGDARYRAWILEKAP